MKHVLYTSELEPITIIELNAFCEDYLLKHGRVALPVLDMPHCMKQHSATDKLQFKTLTILAERFVYYGVEHMLLITGDEETALLLKAAFLPGQTRALNDVRDRGFVEGFLSAINALR